MAHVFGWWDYDAGTRSLVNTVTGERVRYCGRERVTGALSKGPWTRFEYEHTDLRYPVLVEMGGKDHPVWRLDHVRSAALWRKERNINDPHPPYGVWRRVDDCLTDALACWPNEMTGTGILQLKRRKADSRQIDVVGGVLNGQWSHDLKRTMASRFSPSVTLDRSDSFDRNVSPQDLDQGRPSPWIFHDFTGDEIATELLLPGMTPPWNIYDVTLEYDFPVGLPLEGLEGKTAFMRTQDGSRLLFPTSIPTTSIEPVPPDVEFLYVDENIICKLSGRSTGYQWIIKRAGQNFSFRKSPPTRQLAQFAFDPGTGPYGFGAPNYNLSVFLNWIIIESFLKWQGISKSFGIIDLQKAEIVTLAEGYIGGIKCRRWQRAAQAK